MRPTLHEDVPSADEGAPRHKDRVLESWEPLKYDSVDWFCWENLHRKP